MYFYQLINKNTHQVDNVTESYEQAIVIGSTFQTPDKPERGYDGNLYLKGFAPQKPLDQLKAERRTERDAALKETDVYMLIDFPISEEERELYRQYRQYLRDFPKAENFPEVEVMSFKEWSQWIGG